MKKKRDRKKSAVTFLHKGLLPICDFLFKHFHRTDARWWQQPALIPLREEPAATSSLGKEKNKAGRG